MARLAPKTRYILRLLLDYHHRRFVLASGIALRASMPLERVVRTLQRLLASGLVERPAWKTGVDSPARYRLTPAGRQVVRAE